MSDSPLNIAVIGNGRTGSAVVELIEQSTVASLAGVFDQDNPVSAQALQGVDVAIVFVPPTAMGDIVPVLLESGVHVVCGTTGYHWSRALWAQINNSQSRWVLSHNFSLGMNLVRRCLQILGQSPLLYGQPSYRISETHHTNKLDAPSGTAISWRDWLGHDCDIESIREGDVKGLHQLFVETEFEQIEIRHEAKDRALFAQGALWAAANLSNVPFGAHPFSALVDNHLATVQMSEGAF